MKEHPPLDEWLATLSERPLSESETEEFRALLKSSPGALDQYLDHCEMETWLAAGGEALLATEPAHFLAVAARPDGTGGHPAPVPASLPRKAVAAIAVAAALVLVAGTLFVRSLRSPDSPAPPVAGSSAPGTTVASLPSANDGRGTRTESPTPNHPSSNRAAATLASTESATFNGERDPWKTIQGTGAVQHPGLTEKAVPELAKQDRPIKFNRDIRPILSETCFSCHGPDEHGRRADLRLDLPEGATADLGGTVAIAPGDLKNSEAWWRITSDDKGELMPPPESHLVLTDEQKRLIGRWIEEGAAYEGHWAYETPVKPLLPATSLEWGDHEVDAFILARLEEEDLAPSPEAPPATLVRRLHFDLTGLPPTLDEVRDFVASYDRDGEKAYLAAVDDLLASPHFGERMAVPWLDQARYADTNGYSIDGGRDMWLWRDWVIQAYNSNLPFDRFTVEQIAGDLLPDASESQIVATGFSRNHMITHEGGTIPEENLTNYAADRVKTASEVFLGLTMACAQCHDHKYDPISIKEYYEFFAFFNELDDRGLDGNAGVNANPKMMAHSVIPDDELEEVRRELDTLQTELATSEVGFENWLAEVRQRELGRGEGFVLHPLELLDASSPNRPGQYEILKDGSVFLEKPSAGLNAFSHALRLPAEAVVNGIRIRIPLHDEGSPKLTPHPDGIPKITTVLASAGDQPAKQVEFYRQLGMTLATASSHDGEHAPRSVLDERNLHWWQPARGDREAHLSLTFSDPVDASEAPYLTVMIFYGTQHAMPHRWKIEAFSGNDPDSELPGEVAGLVRTAPQEWTPEERETVLAHFRKEAPVLEGLRIRVQNLAERIEVLTKPHSTMVMNVAPTPRETHILDRGQYDVKREKVSANTPRILLPLETGADPSESGSEQGRAATRLDLARWMVDSENPLTARVAVNRIWAMLFGTGIVSTTADFGSQGEWPSHPELLDWLATEFVESGWDQKALIRTLVTSNTYRQDSRATPEMREKDPGNRLLARGPRYRLAAEFVRDQALATSGLLVPRIGGPSVQPYQPPGLWKEVSHFGSTPATKQVFVQDRGEKLYRRSLYTIVKRTSPHPAMAAFDAPNREMCITERGVTNTPLQALVTLNDPQFAEAARVFAAKLLRETPGAEDSARLRSAFEHITGRLPGAAEQNALRSFLSDERDRFEANESAAKLAVAIGEAPTDPELDVIEQAVWTQISSLIFNLSETLTRL